MGSYGLTSLLSILAFGLFFYWMMKKNGYDMHGHGGDDHDDSVVRDAPLSDVTGSTEDPLRGMPIDPNRAVVMRSVRERDRTFYLSSAYCQSTFDADARSIARRAPVEGSRAEHKRHIDQHGQEMSGIRDERGGVRRSADGRAT